MFYNPATVREWMAVLVVTMPSFTLGINNAWLSATFHYFDSKSPLGPLSRQYFSWLSSIPFLSALLGLLFWGPLSERLGRKATGFILGVPSAVMYAMMCFSHDQTVVLIARGIGGFANVGCIMCVALYVKEIARSQTRQRLLNMFSLSLSLGGVYVITVATFLSYNTLHWLLLFICVLYLLLICLIPESPVFHIKNDDFDKARSSLEWLRQTKDETVLNNEIEILKQLFIKKSSIKFVDIFRNKYYIKTMLMGFFLQTAIINATGFSVITTFSSAILVNLLGEVDVNLYNVAFTVFEALGCLLAFPITNLLGRRTYIVSSCMGCSVILFTIALSQHVQVFHLFPLVLLISYIVLYTTITFPVTYIYFNEILASESSNHIFTIMVLGKNLGWFCSVKLFIYIAPYLHTDGTFMLFGSTCLMVAIVTMFFPESKNKSLQTIKEELHC
uniref:Facilitated trehalose transporter Tret1 n=1 Tax=Cacopsylla melanoneura TaxID=428564 RepID=A0A8D8QWJ0_9HEMI